MIYRYTPSLNRTAFGLHDCVATDVTYENGDLTFFFPDGIITGKELSPKGRYLSWGRSAPAKLTFVGADLAFFHVYWSWKNDGERLHSSVTGYELPEVIKKVSSGEWRIEFFDEYCNGRADFYRCVILQKEDNGGRGLDLLFALDYEQLICEWNEEDNPEQGVDLFADGLHFLGNTEEERKQDLCLHGKVTMRVNGHIFADEKECCVTASALRFLRSLSSDHKTGEEEFLFPCCGNMLIPSDDGKTVTVIGCPHGEDLEISTHRAGNQTKIANKDACQFVTFDEYRAAVLAYAKQVLRFLQNSPERVFKDDYEKAGYEAFLTEFNDLMEKHKL